MKPSSWPDWLDALWAKSSMTPGQSGESLAQHTWLVLERLAELIRLRPDLASYLNASRLWHCLFWACFLHDLGKAASGFQLALRGKKRWKRRHEVLSLAFLDWIAASFSVTEQQWVLAAIVSHHRDASEIIESYDQYSGLELVEGMLIEIDEPTVRGLWRWLHDCSASWIEALGLSEFGVLPVMLVDEKQAVHMVRVEGVRRTYAWLTSYRRFIKSLPSERDLRIVTTLVMLRGLTTTADHAASAHLAQIPQGVQRSWETLAEDLAHYLRTQSGNQKEITIYNHQSASALNQATSAMLIAPTGSGKTESALFWVLGDGTKVTSRVFYTLPYQASMNAMYDRLRSPHYFGEQSVGLQHGRALQVLYQHMLNSENGPASPAQAAKWQQNLARLHACTVKVFSPYQMLKTLYQLRGFEGMLADYTHAAFIFDEIHAYEANRLALILALVKHLRENYGARFFVMSATFPSILREIMPEILGIDQPIRADAELFQQFRRHHLKLLDGDLLQDGIDQIAVDVQQGKSVLVCCNTVAKAQDVYKILQERLGMERTKLIHSRFTIKDRSAREREIRACCEIGTTHSAIAIVATQVVEVSLNIDLDTIYSDPAPLDALVQRFGRVNRACKKGIVPVHIFRQPSDGQGVYQENLVQKTLEVLEQHNDEDIDEMVIEQWLDEIYSAPAIHDPWKEAYDRQYALATSLLQDLRPFDANKALEEKFAELFDGIEVLPQCFEEQYITYTTQNDFLEASQLFVGISYKKYQALRSKGKVLPMEDVHHKRWVVLQEYSEEFGLLLDMSSNTPVDEY